MFDFMGNKKYFFTISIVIILLGIAFAFINGLEWDIQFQGGTLIQVEMSDDTFDEKEIGQAVSDELGKTVTPQKMSTFNPESADDKISMLSLKVSSAETLNDVERDKVVTILREKYGVKEDAEIKLDSVDPFIGKEMKKDALLATVIASVLIILYVWWRFSVISGLAAAITSVVALIHDILIMFAFYAIFQFPLNESFVASVLFILGYSMNDTIIVYDRIRENTGSFKKIQLDELVNKSIMQTMSRTLNTLITTLICVLVIYVFAAVNNIQSLREFTLPLLVGLISGCYSSVFIASPLWAMWKQHQTKKKMAVKASKA